MKVKTIGEGEYAQDHSQLSASHLHKHDTANRNESFRKDH